MYIGENDSCCDDCNSGLGLAPIVAPLIGASATLLSTILGHGKAPTMSAFGFHVDEYAAHILDAETQIVNLRNAVAQALHQPPPVYPMSPWPPNPQNMPSDPAFKGSGCVYGGVPCSQWASAIRPIVAQYSAQSDCVTNNNQVSPGGCYEQAYGAQLQIINGLKNQLAQVSGGAIVPTPAPGSPTNIYPAVLPGGALNFAAPAPYYSAPSQTVPQYPIAQSPVYLPSQGSSPITITTPSAPSLQAAGFENWPLLLAGALGLILILTMPREAQTAPSNRKGRR